MCKMEVEFSVIVPIYKVEPYLGKCIDSILNQSYRNFELILVDDGSPDNCPAICDMYAASDSRVRVLHKVNGGLVSARNSGIKSATGKYICYVDGDDWIEPELLNKVHEKVISHYDADIIIYNMVKQYDSYREKIPFYVKEGYYSKEKLETEIYPYMMWDFRKSFYHGMVFPSAGGKIIKRKILIEHYCQDERIRMGEDNAFIFECIYAADSVYFLPEDLYIYNQLNQGSFLHSYDAKRFYNNRLLVDYISKKLRGKNVYIDKQINAFKAYWLIMAIFHEVKCNRPLLVSAKHIKENIELNLST